MDTAPKTIKQFPRRHLLTTAAAGLASYSVGLGISPASSAAEAKTFYVSNAGNDDAYGESPETAWATLARVKRAVGARRINRGDRILFRAGDEWFGDITWVVPSSGTDPHLTFSSYGSGPKPRISRYKICNNPSSWVKHATNIWKIDLTSGSGAFTGNIESNSTNVGFIRVGGTIYGCKRWTLSLMQYRWDFFSDERFLYVYSVSNPATVADFRAAVAGNIINAASSMTVRGLELVGTGGHGFWVSNGCGNIRLEDTIIREIGGSALPGSYQTRYGNGVELWIGSWDVTVTNNQISDVYDVAVTMQGKQSSTLLGWRNCTVSGNRIDRCTQAFEVWSEGIISGSGSGHINCLFQNNTCTRSGYSWGMLFRPAKNGQGTHILFYTTQLNCDIQISGNTFDDAFMNYCYFLYTPPKDLVMNRNTIRLKAGIPVQHQIQKYTVERHLEWSQFTGLELESSFQVI